MNTKTRVALVFIFFTFIQLTFAEEIDIKAMSLDSLLNISVSTASKYEQKTSEAPSSVTIITAEDIKRFGYQTLEEILSSVRGFYINNDRNYSYLGVRGFGRPTDYNNRIQVLLNGCTLNDNIYYSSLLGTELGLSLEAIERIEIVRGPGSVMYGAGAMLTVINLITKEAEFEEGVKTLLKAGNFGKKQVDFTVSKEFKNQLGVFFAGNWGDIKGEDIYFKEFDSPETNHGMAEDVDGDKFHSALLKLTWKDFILQSLFSRREKSVPTGAWETVFNHPDSRVMDQRGLLEIGYKKQIRYNKTISIRSFINSYINKQTYPFDINYDDNANGLWYGGEIQYLWDIFSNYRFMAGVEYQKFHRAKYSYKNDEEMVFSGDFPQHVSAIYSQSQYQPWSNLSFTLGLRREEFTESGAVLTPRAAIIYNPFVKSTWKLLYGEAYRMPDVYEKHYIEKDYQKINPSLNKEKINTWELIYEQRITKNLYGIFALYDYTIKDLIEWTFDSNDSLYWYRNLGETKAQGVEMEMNLRYDSGYLWYINASWQKARVVNSDLHISNSPQLLLKTGISCPVSSFINSSLEMYWESKRYSVYNTTTEPYLLINYYLTLNTLFNHLRFSLSARNLLNTGYALPGGLEHTQHFIPQRGRTITFGAEFNF